MRRLDKLKNIQRANMLAEQRYLESKGVIKENLSNREKKILDDILNEISNLYEADFNNVIKKVKDYAAKGLLTAGIITALLATPNITQAQSDAIKNAANIENVEQTQQKMTIDQFINMLDTNHTEVYQKLKAGDEDLINIIKDIFIDKNTNKIDWDADDKLGDWVLDYFLPQGKAKIGSGDPRASEDIKKGVVLRDREHYNDIKQRNKDIMAPVAFDFTSEEDEIIRLLYRKIQGIYWDEEERLNKQ